MYDIVLVYHFGRTHSYYLNIIKYLSTRYRIGLLLSDEENFTSLPSRKSLRKVKETEKKFRSLCSEYGAEKIHVNQKHNCRLLLMPVEGTAFTGDYLTKLQENISWKRLTGIFYLYGNRMNIAKDLGATKYFAPGKAIMEHRYKSEDRLNELKGLDIIEAGFPYLKYPVFDDLHLDIDYIIALPSGIHFRGGKSKEKYEFTSTLLKTLNKLDKDNKIYIKQHNVLDKERFGVRTRRVEKIYFLKLLSLTYDFLIKTIPFKKDRFYQLASHLKYNIIEKQYPSLEELTEYSNLGLELFLPHVRKGLLTGHSTTIYYSLYNKLPAYRCDPQEETIGAPVYTESYRIPCCNGKLDFDEDNFKKIDEASRRADIIQLIKDELKGL